MSSQPHQPLLEVEPRGPVTLVRFSGRSIWQEEPSRDVGEQLFGLVTDNCRLVLNFGTVESMGSTMLGKLFALHKKVQAAGGRLAFCRVDPFLYQIFNVVKLTTLVPI